MKFYCDACHTKYAISDDKVRGKVLKVRCKNCGNVITVRENQAPTAARPSAAPARGPHHTPAPEVPTTNWYYAINGQTFGPFTLTVLRGKYEKAEVTDASYVWHETLGEWKPVATVETFQDALYKGHQIRPRMQTLGFTGALEAVKVGAEPSTAREGAVPNKAHAEASAAPLERKPVAKSTFPPPGARGSSPSPGKGTLPPVRPATPRPAQKPQAPTPEARDNDLRKEKLDRLRQRLTLDSASPMPAVGRRPSAPNEPVARQPEPKPQPAEDFEPLPKPVTGGAVLTFAPGLNPDGSEPSLPGGDVINFDLPPARPEPARPSPSSSSDILDTVLGPTESTPHVDDPVDSGVIPFFPEAPHLEARGGAVRDAGQTSESLLIEMKSLQKEGRAKRTGLYAGALVVALLVIGVGVGVAVTSDEAPAVAAEEQGAVAYPKQRDELVIRTYSKDEVSKLATMELEEEFLFGEEEGTVTTTDDAEEDAAPEAPAKVQKPAAAAAEKPNIKTAAKPAEPKPRGSKAEPTIVVATKTPTVEEAPAPGSQADLVSSLLKPRKEIAVNRPEDKLAQQTQQRGGLTKDQARQGFRDIRNSVRFCRESHNRHNAPLAAQKIKLMVKVEPGGRVSDFSVGPASVQHTEFDKCMQLRKKTWKFPPFQGEPVVINTSIVLQ